MQMRPVRGVEIKGCTSHAEFNECVALQRAVWHFADLDIVTADLLLLAARTGGQVLGAFDNQRMIGFAYSVPALRSKLVYLHSHMVAVLPEYQNHGVGRQLKLVQREEALRRCKPHHLEPALKTRDPNSVAAAQAPNRSAIDATFGRTPRKLYRDALVR